MIRRRFRWRNQRWSRHASPTTLWTPHRTGWSASWSWIAGRPSGRPAPRNSAHSHWHASYPNAATSPTPSVSCTANDRRHYQRLLRRPNCHRWCSVASSCSFCSLPTAWPRWPTSLGSRHPPGGSRSVAAPGIWCGDECRRCRCCYRNRWRWLCRAWRLPAIAATMERTPTLRPTVAFVPLVSGHASPLAPKFRYLFSRPIQLVITTHQTGESGLNRERISGSVGQVLD